MPVTNHTLHCVGKQYARKILSLTGSVRASCTNFLMQAVMLVTLGETSRHFSTRVHEHLSSDRSSHVYKHLQASESYRTSCNLDCFKILDSAPTKYQVKLKESCASSGKSLTLINRSITSI